VSDHINCCRTVGPPKLRGPGSNFVEGERDAVNCWSASLKLPALPLYPYIFGPPFLTMDLSSRTIATYAAISIATLIFGRVIMGFFSSNKFPVEGKVCFSSAPHETSHDACLHSSIADDSSRRFLLPVLPKDWVSAQLPNSLVRVQTSFLSLVARANSKLLSTPSRFVVLTTSSGTFMLI